MDLLSSEFTVDDEEETDESLDLVFVMCWSDQTYQLQRHPLLPDPDQPTIDSFLSLTSFSTKVVWKFWSVLKWAGFLFQLLMGDLQPSDGKAFVFAAPKWCNSRNLCSLECNNIVPCPTQCSAVTYRGSTLETELMGAQSGDGLLHGRSAAARERQFSPVLQVIGNFEVSSRRSSKHVVKVIQAL